MRRIAVSTVSAAALLTLATACGGGSDDPSPEPSTSAGSSASGTPSADSSPSDSEGATPAATGVLLVQPHAQVRGPAGWRRAEVLVRTMVSADDRHTPSTMSLGEIDAFGGTSDIDEVAENALTTLPYDQLPKRLPNTQLDGVEVYHLAGMVQDHLYHEEFGANVDDRLVSLVFDLSDLLSPAERREVVDSVVASFRWR